MTHALSLACLLWFIWTTSWCFLKEGKILTSPANKIIRRRRTASKEPGHRACKQWCKILNNVAIICTGICLNEISLDFEAGRGGIHQRLANSVLQNYRKVSIMPSLCLNCVPPIEVEVLTYGICQGDSVWKQSLCRCNTVKMGSQWALNPMVGVLRRRREKPKDRDTEIYRGDRGGNSQVTTEAGLEWCATSQEMLRTDRHP